MPTYSRLISLILLLLTLTGCAKTAPPPPSAVPSPTTIKKPTQTKTATPTRAPTLRAVTPTVSLYHQAAKRYTPSQVDVATIESPRLSLALDAPSTVSADETFTVALTLTNPTAETLTDVVISAPIPRYDLDVETISTGGVEAEDKRTISWSLPELEGQGGAAVVRFTAQAIVDDVIWLERAQMATAQGIKRAESMPRAIFVGERVAVWGIQGESDRSPYLNDTVTTGGVVSGVFPGLGGFWIQVLEGDGNPATSEGLFIYAGDLRLDITAGDWVQVSGTAQEHYQQTQLRLESPEDVELLSRGNPLPAAVELNPPVEQDQARRYYEALEGMFVQVSGPAPVVAPTNRYGEFALVQPEHELERLWQGAENGLLIVVDDGSLAVHADRSTLAYAAETGDRVSGVAGPLAFTYGQYKLEPVTTPIIVAAAQELPHLPLAQADTFSLMTWNVENLFDSLEPHPSSPPLPSPEAYKVDLTKTANTILAAGAPSIVALQEVEHLGVLKDLAADEALAEYEYQPLLIEGTDGRGIDVGYLARGDQVVVLDVWQFPAPDGLAGRPPLLLEVEMSAASDPLRLYLINNHFKSMRGGVEATEPLRVAQACWNVAILETLLDQDPDALVAVMGDLNAYYQSEPLDILREAGLIHVFERLPQTEGYTYIYEGESQALDHILVTPALMERLRHVDVLHLNADFAPPIPGDDSPLRASDHDPVVAIFALEP